MYSLNSQPFLVHMYQTYMDIQNKDNKDENNNDRSQNNDLSGVNNITNVSGMDATSDMVANNYSQK